MRPTLARTNEPMTVPSGQRPTGQRPSGQQRGHVVVVSVILAAVVALIGLSTTRVWAQAIYPANRAEILAGARFDFKVEFPKVPTEADVTVTINGRALADVFGKPPTFIQNEDNWGRSVLWLRDVELPKAGPFVVEASSAGLSVKANWEVFATKPRVAKNVILFIGDGLSVAHRTAARMMSKQIESGHYNGQLAMDDMPHMALVSTSGSDSVVTDSANSMSAYTTGHKTCGGAMGVYCASNKSLFEHPRVETLAELVKRRLGLAVGIVTTTEVVDATPGAMVAHTASRLTRNEIATSLFDANPDVLLGGGWSYFQPQSIVGSKRADEIDYTARFRERGYQFVTTASEMTARSQAPSTSRLLGLFHPSNMDGALDRRVTKGGSVKTYPDQPDLPDMVRSALDVLSRKPEGFVLMVESGRIDQFSHALDWERAVYETILLDNAVKVAKDWAELRNDTLIVVVPDHAHPVSIIGTIDDARPGTRLRDKMAVYDAKFPNYPPPDSEGYPGSVDVSRRLALVFGAVPDHCATGKPTESPVWPTQAAPKAADGNVANEKLCGPGATRLTGNLPKLIAGGVHAADDVILTASGPGAEQFRGHMENTRVFRAIATALGLAGEVK
jgi:alkaline phosphatase